MPQCFNAMLCIVSCLGLLLLSLWKCLIFLGLHRGMKTLSGPHKLFQDCVEDVKLWLKFCLVRIVVWSMQVMSLPDWGLIVICSHVKCKQKEPMVIRRWQKWHWLFQTAIWTRWDVDQSCTSSTQKPTTHKTTKKQQDHTAGNWPIVQSLRFYNLWHMNSRHRQIQNFLLLCILYIVGLLSRSHYLYK